jgi:NAD(P)-dependent dehydrogenase (short-subunit alcohol dehydrogenase family)
MDFGLKNRRALVMGGTKGLGRSIADALAEEGAALTISGRDQGRLDEAAAETPATSGRRSTGCSKMRPAHGSMCAWSGQWIALAGESFTWQTPLLSLTPPVWH